MPWANVAERGRGQAGRSGDGVAPGESGPQGPPATTSTGYIPRLTASPATPLVPPAITPPVNGDQPEEAHPPPSGTDDLGQPSLGRRDELRRPRCAVS